MRLTRHWDTARPLLDHALARCEAARYPTGTCNAIRLQIVLNEYDSANFEASLAMMDVIEANGGAGVSAQERAKWRARALSRIDREQEAYDVFDAYWSRRGQRARDREMGEFAADLGMYPVALEHYRRLWSRREFETFDGAFMVYLAGEHAEAATLFEITARRASGTNADRANYWLARTYEALGRIDDARATYRAVATRNPVSYYALQAQNREEEWAATLANDPAATARVEQPGRIHWTGRLGAPRASLEDARATATADLFEPYAPAVQAPGAVDAFAEAWGELFPDAHVAAALLHVGAQEPARQAFREPLTEFYMLDALFSDGRRPTERRPIRLDMQRWEHEIDNRRQDTGWWGIALTEPRYPVPEDRTGRAQAVARQQAIYEARAALREPFRAAARELTDHFMVRRLAVRHASLPNLLNPSADLRGWLEAYPHAYGHVAERSMEAHDLNPYLLWSLMIVESDLNPDSISHADAYGLLQVIPKTGELIATGFGQPDFGIHDVIEVDDAFRYGAWYLDQLLYKFDGQEMLAAVAYNAGPHQVARWIDWRGDVLDMDELIETVPYDGARRYPQRLLRYLLTYRLAYGESDRVYLGNALDPNYEDNIYY
jgi:soluble lytic murein transglycosylase-like protein